LTGWDVRERERERERAEERDGGRWRDEIGGYDDV
jgi:hypothetical protein